MLFSDEHCSVHWAAAGQGRATAHPNAGLADTVALRAGRKAPDTCREKEEKESPNESDTFESGEVTRL